VTNQNTEPDFVALTSGIVAAYVTNNPVSAGGLPTLIQQVHQSLTVLVTGTDKEPPPPLQIPAVPIKRSYTDEAITCLECGLEFKMLRRHLGADHGLTPDQYLAKWNLPREYPLVAPTYSQRRSELAKASGLGRSSGGKEF